MGDSSLSPDEIRAAAAVHDELGPDYHEAVVESFLEKIDQEVGARIDARLAATRQAETSAADRALLDRKRAQLGAMAAGSALAAVASGAAVAWSVHYPGSSPAKALALVWAILAVVYIAYAWRLRRR
jgi:predicted ArsR family transcriptional regulator